MASRYPDGLLEYVRDNYKHIDNIELTKKVNALFEVNMSEIAMKSLKKRYRLVGGKEKVIYSDVFPEKVSMYIQKHYAGVGPKKMAETLNRKFGTSYTRAQVKGYYANHKLNSGLDGRFLKGQESHNKGKKMDPSVYEKIKHTFYPKGHIPDNKYDVGTVKMNTDGYYMVKVADPNVWEFCHRKAWEDANGKIPKGMMVCFKNGDKTDYRLENLMLISQEEHGWLNVMHMRSDIPEVTETAVTLAKLSTALRKRKKDEKKKIY